MKVYLPSEDEKKLESTGTMRQCETTPTVWCVRTENAKEVVA